MCSVYVCLCAVCLFVYVQCALFYNLGQQAGYPYTDDLNGFQQEGVGPMDSTTWKGSFLDTIFLFSSSHLFFTLCVSLSSCLLPLCFCLSLFLPMFLSLSLSISLTHPPFIYLSPPLSLCLSLSLYPSLCLSLSLSLSPSHPASLSTSIHLSVNIFLYQQECEVLLQLDISMIQCPFVKISLQKQDVLLHVL